MRNRRGGMILVLVMVVVALLALAAGTFSYLMVAERKATHVAGQRAQARASADSGVEMALLLIAQDKDYQDQLGGWYDNQTQFRGRMLAGSQQTQDVGQFTIISPRIEYGVAEGIRYGLEDDTGRLNLNVLSGLDSKSPGTGQKLLMGLPGMTEEIADSILDWMDKDEEIREFGAESGYYSGLQPPCSPKNGPLESIEELLLVRGIRENPWLLFGCDINRNGVIDPGEPDSQSISDVDNSDGSMNRGWSAFLTLHSLEANLNPDGEKKINLNQNNLEKLFDQLEEALGKQWATFIVAYRLGEDADDDEPATSVGGNEDLDLSQQPKRNLSTVLDLIGKNVKLSPSNEGGNTSGGAAPEGGSSTGGGETSGGGSSRGGGSSAGGGESSAGGGAAPVGGASAPAAPGQEMVLQTPFPNEPGAMDSYLPKLMDYVAVFDTAPLAGRININQAPRTVLLGIPGMTEQLADRIISEREPDPTIALPGRRHETWILSEGLVTLEEMKALMPFVCAGGCVFRAQVVGFSSQGGPTVRIETILDASQSPARIVFWRDISNLGRGYPLETLQGLGGDLETTY